MRFTVYCRTRKIGNFSALRIEKPRFVLARNFEIEAAGRILFALLIGTADKQENSFGIAFSYCAVNKFACFVFMR